MEVVSEKKGEKSIQINGLEHILKDKRFSSFKQFINHFDDAEVVGEKTKKQLAPYFKIFIIMDTDDCSEEQKNKFISKEMFQGHWARKYIVPIFNSPDLESVLVKAGIQFEKKGAERKKEYIKIFPTGTKYSHREGVELQTFAENLKKVEDSNLYQFIQHCLESAE